MNILVVCQYYYPEPFRITDICDDLVKRGYKVTVLTGLPNYPAGKIYPGYENKFKEQINGVNIVRCNIRPRKSGNKNLAINYISFVIEASKKLKKFSNKYDLVFVYQLSPVTMGIPAIRFGKKHNIPIYLYCCDIWPESAKDALGETPVYGLAKKVSKYVYKNVTHIAVKSPSFKEYLTKEFGLGGNKISYVAEFADDSYLGIDSHPLDNGIVDFVFMGNIGVSQNCNLFIEAAEKLEGYKNFLIHFVGDGSAIDELKKKAQSSKVADKVVFHGRHPVKDMPDFYKIADVCLLSLTNTDATGLTLPAKLTGYMAAGRPVLASINGDAQDVIKSAGCGYCAEADNANALAVQMKKCVDEPDKLMHMGEQGREFFKEHFVKKKCMDFMEIDFLEMLKSYQR